MEIVITFGASATLLQKSVENGHFRTGLPADRYAETIFDILVPNMLVKNLNMLGSDSK